MRYILIIALLLTLSGCAAFNPNGRVTFDYNPETGLISYDSTKSVSISVKTEENGTKSISVDTDASVGIKERAEAWNQTTDRLDELTNALETLVEKFK